MSRRLLLPLLLLAALASMGVGEGVGQWRPPTGQFDSCTASHIEAGTCVLPDDPSPIYYVDPTTGSDSDTGLTTALAWASVTKVNATSLPPGSAVLFKRGEVFLLAGVPLALDPGVRYSAYGDIDDKPILQPGQSVTTWTVDAGARYSTPFVHTVNSGTDMVWEDGVKGIREASAAAVGAAGEFYFDNATDTLYYQARDGADPDTHTMIYAGGASSGASGQYYAINPLASYAQVSDIEIRYCGGRCINDSVGNQDILLENMKIHDGTTNGISFGNNGVGKRLTIRNTEVYNIADSAAVPANSGAIISSAGGTLLDHVYSHDNGGSGAQLQPKSNTSVAGEAGWTGIVRNSNLRHNGSSGVSVLNSSSGMSLIENNDVSENCANTDDTKGIHVFDTATVRWNRVWNNGIAGAGTYGCGGIQCDEAGFGAFDGCNIYGNLFYNNTGMGVSTVGAFTGTTRITHNTIVHNSWLGPAARPGVLLSNPGTNDYVISNNIIAFNGPTAGTSNQLESAASTVTGDFDKNIIYDNRPLATNLVKWVATNYTAIATWEAAFTSATGNLNSNPRIVDVGGGDLRLQVGSGAIGAALAGLAPSHDYYGINYGYPASIGASESSVLPGIVSTIIQTADATSATPSSITGLSFPVDANRNYIMDCYIASTSADATTGILYSVTGPAAPTSVGFSVKTFSGAATSLEETFSAFAFTSAATASVLTTEQLNQVHMRLRNGSNAGTVQVTINPEANTSVTAEIGSWCKYSAGF